MNKNVTGNTPKQEMMKEFAPMIARNLKYNIRAAKRFLNDLQFAENLAAHAGVDVTAYPDALLRWSIVSYVRPDLANMIRGNVANLEIMVKRIPAVKEKLSGQNWKPTKEIFDAVGVEDSLREWLEESQVVELVQGFPSDLSVLKSLISFSEVTESVEDEGKPEESRRGPSVAPSGDKMVRVPKGPFLYGEEKASETIDYDFEIDMYPVTNQQFREFIEDGGYDEKQKTHWDQKGWEWIKEEGITQPRLWDDPKWNQPDHPVVGVSWYEADAFARWAGKRLPTEKEWEKAARGTDGRVYPWGNEFDAEKCNSRESGIGGTTPVTKYVNGLSPYQCYDIAGNVWEWTDSWFDAEKKSCVLRGGSWINGADYLRASFRDWDFPSGRDFDFGFRCARDAR